MLRFYAVSFVQIGLLIDDICVLLESAPKALGLEILSKPTKNRLNELIGAIEQQCQRHGFSQTQDHLDWFKHSIENAEPTYSEASTFIKHLTWTFNREIKKHFFVHVPIDRVPYIKDQDIFGQKVSASFRSTVQDIQSAGRCYATGNSTACVFHSMRVLEKGLHVLGKHLNVPSAPMITLTQWGTIINEIESRVKELLNEPKSIKRSKSLKSISKFGIHFRFFQHAWRDHVAHSRETYEDAAAIKVLEHVGDFMRELADAGLKEAPIDLTDILLITDREKP